MAQGDTQAPIVKGLIIVSCIDLLVLHVGCMPTEKQFKVWNIFGYDWNVRQQEVSASAEATGSWVEDKLTWINNSKKNSQRDCCLIPKILIWSID